MHESLLLRGVVLPRTADDPLPLSSPGALRRCRDGSILVALFDISLAGDLEGEEISCYYLYMCALYHDMEYLQVYSVKF